MSAFPRSACNEDGEPIMSAEDWYREQRADEDAYWDQLVGPDDDDGLAMGSNGPDPADDWDEPDIEGCGDTDPHEPHYDEYGSCPGVPDGEVS